MSKKTLIIVLAIVAIGILVVVVVGRTANQTEEPVTVDDDTFFNEIDEDFNNEPIEFNEDVTTETEVEVEEIEMTEEMDEELTE